MILLVDYPFSYKIKALYGRRAGGKASPGTKLDIIIDANNDAEQAGNKALAAM